MSGKRNPKVHKCALCPFSTKFGHIYKNHLITHSTEKPFKCPKCPFKTKRMCIVKQHFNNIHLNKSEAQTFPCKFSGCNYAAKRKENLVTHSKIHSGEKSFFCSHSNCNYSAIQKTGLTNHMKTHTGEKPFVCEFESCSFAAARPYDLVKHMRIHTKERPYKCPEPNCEYSTAQIGALKTHQLTHEPKEGEEHPSFSCPICEFTTKYKSALIIHHKRKHSDEKPFTCSFETCEYRCKTKSVLSQHLKSHSEERQYKCELCPFRAKLRNTVTSHLQNVHSDPNFRPFKCTEAKCEMDFRTRGTLKQHILIHTGQKKYSCSFPNCDFRAITKSGIKSHEYFIHSQEKKEKCAICTFTCKVKCTLTIHMRTHTKEEPYKCKEEGCEYRAKCLSNLNGHIKQHHSQGS